MSPTTPFHGRYEFSEEPGELYVRGFVELRLMKLGELLYMPLPMRIAAMRSDPTLAKLDKAMPHVAQAALHRGDAHR